jgi:hypothetical protein
MDMAAGRMVSGAPTPYWNYNMKTCGLSMVHYGSHKIRMNTLVYLDKTFGSCYNSMDFRWRIAPER